MLIIRGAYDSEENHMQFRHVNMTADMFTGLTNTLVENGDSFDMIKDLDSVQQTSSVSSSSSVLW